MLKAFRIAVEDTPLFCRQCRGVFVHSLKARQPLYPGTPAPPGEPLVAMCHRCQHPQIHFAREFATFSPPHRDGSVFKVAGRSRLQPKDWIYVPGQPCTGSVKSRYRKGTVETFVINQEDGTELPISFPVQTDYPPSAMESYRLIPPYLADTRIGDPVYHINRQQFGKAIGYLFGKESKLVILLENETLILIQLPPSHQIADNHTLLQQADTLFKEALGTDGHGIHLDAGLGVLYATGTCPSLSMIRQLRNLVKKIPGSRGMVDVLAVQPPVQVSDPALLDQLHHVILHYPGSVFGIQVSCQNGYAVVEGFCRNETARTELAHLLENIPGLRSLQMNLRIRTHDDPKERDKAQVVAQALRRNSSLRSAQIRVSSIQGVIYLEGIVSSSLQRNAASLASMWAGRHLKVENKLQILKQASGEPFIRIS